MKTQHPRFMVTIASADHRKWYKRYTGQRHAKFVVEWRFDDRPTQYHVVEGEHAGEVIETSHAIIQKKWEPREEVWQAR